MSSPQVDLTRNDIVIELHVVAGLLEIANIYAGLALDEDLAKALNDARDHLRRALSLGAKLMQARRDADINREAAEEWRAERDGRRCA